MKILRRYKFLGLLIAVIIIASCKKTKNEVVTPQLSVSSTEELFTADGGVSEVTVTSNTTWSISNAASWFTATASATEGNGKLSLNVQSNPTATERSAVITVSSATISKQIKVRQSGKANGDSIPASIVIWAAGIKGNVPAGIDKELIARGNRIKVDRHCLVNGFTNIYAIGDVAYMEEPAWPNGHPQVAPVAMQQADLLTNNLSRLEMKSGDDQLQEFVYNDSGSMATVGRNLAVVDMPKPKLHFGGFFAWMIWMGLHLMLILGVKNRFFVFTNWLYNYFTYDQNLRLIFKAFYREPKPAQPIEVANVEKAAL